MPSQLCSCLSVLKEETMAQLNGREKESKYWATTLRREVSVAREHATPCAACNGELRVAAKAVTDGRDHKPLP